jgi:hypothetical protein
MSAICCRMLFSDIVDVSARRSQYRLMERCSNDAVGVDRSGRRRADVSIQASGAVAGRALTRISGATATDGATQGAALTVYANVRAVVVVRCSGSRRNKGEFACYDALDRKRTRA